MNKSDAEKEIRDLAVEYMRWAYPNGCRDIGDLSVATFLRTYKSAISEIGEIYTQILGYPDPD